MNIKNFVRRIGTDLVVGSVVAIGCGVLIGFAVAQTVPDDFSNTFAGAHSIMFETSGDEIQTGVQIGIQRGVIESPGDVDFFTFKAPFTGWMKVRQVPTSTSTLNAALYAYRWDQVRLAKSDGPDISEEVLFKIHKNERYYLQAAKNVSTTGEYEITFERGLPMGKKPNIILIYTDDQSYSSISSMPFMSQAKRNWFVFENAFVNNPVCCPSRASALTGLWSHHHGVEATGGAPRFDDSSTIATWLDDAGYRTGMFGKYHLGNANETSMDTYIAPGWDEWYNWHAIDARNIYYNYALNENGTLVHYGTSTEDYSTDVLANKVVKFIKESTPEEPFFIYFAPRGPHDPWVPAPRHVNTIPKSRTNPPNPPNFSEADMSDKPLWWQQRPPVDISNGAPVRNMEHETLLSVDDAVLQIWRTLNEKKLLRNTVIVYMSDNGFSYGEHRWGGKMCAYEECIHVPLLVWYPLGNPRTVSRIVSNVDIAPTFAELAGIDPGAPVDGMSMLQLLQWEANNWRNWVLLRGVERVPEYWGLRTDQYKYIHTVKTGELELYDLAKDPYEMESVANKPEYATIQEDMARKLEQAKAAAPKQP